MSTAGTFSKGVAAIPQLATLLGVDRVVFVPRAPRTQIDCVIGWGRKANTVAASLYAELRSLPFLRLEDGFIRSVGLGVEGEMPLSLIVDPIGIYYDATSESLLERWLSGVEDAPTSLDDPALLARARGLIERLRATGISKYNDGSSISPLPPSDRERVLVADQTSGDLSLELGLATPGGLAHMLEAALAENPAAEIVVKVHPDVVRGAKEGEAQKLLQHERVRIVDTYVQPAALFAQVGRVYTRTSQMGFEALWHGKTVDCFGLPFYGGWGLTNDRVAPSKLQRRGVPRSLEQLVAASLILYPRYLDPETRQRTTPERVIEHLALQRTFRDETEKPCICVGFTPWKRAFVPRYLGVRRANVRFVDSFRLALPLGLGKVPEPGSVVAWSSRSLERARQFAAAHQVPLVRMEDGFLRSVGLGSDLVEPLSLVLDRSGIYYDATAPSDLETYLATHAFTDEERARARGLRERIVQTGVSKYVLAETAKLPVADLPREGVVLVVGQVEDDASIRTGCVSIRRNEDLLREVRRSRPGAFVVYRPHPDVTLGGREGHVPRPIERGLCDADATGVAIASLLDLATEVHTMTSLVGFEALLRRKRVVVYGLPFYAGWGLTEDHERCERRGRERTLDELVHGALVHYPRYVHPVSRAFTTPESVLDHLARKRDEGLSQPSRLRPWRRIKNVARQTRRRLSRG